MSSLFAGGSFVVGTTSGYAPFVSLNQEGEYVGFDIDLAKALADKLDSTLVLKDLGSMPSLLLALKQGKIDAIIWAMSITQERQKQMEMIYYQGEKEVTLPLLFWKEIPEANTSLEALAKDSSAIVCVEAGSFQENVLQNIPGLRLKQVDKVMDAILEIKYGKARSAAIDPSLVPGALQQFKEIKVLEVPLSEEDRSLGNGICINKNQGLLAERLRKSVADLQADGTIEQLEKKWKLK
jgi:ABC-type amino acid transport substrate-binding protein